MEKMMYKGFFYFLIVIFMFLNVSHAMVSKVSDSTAREWLKTYMPTHIDSVLDNISPVDGQPGAVIAAKSRTSPNYYYHWVRDAGLTVDALMQIYPFVSDVYKRNNIRRKVFQYIEFSKTIQKINTPAGLGEPKFHVDGTAFTDSWGRPQNDGPAARAISLIQFANILIAEGNENVVTEMLYDKSLPATSPIKMDLEYISHHWRDPSYDLWEEVKGSHFYTLMVQRRALIEGAKLAYRFADDRAASWYAAQARQIEAEIEKFYDQSLGHFVPTMNYIEGADYKHSKVDTAVLLGLLHGGLNDGFLQWDDKRVLATIEKLISTFEKLYPINHVASIPGVAIGRYPEDVYDGMQFKGGNPWVLCTLAVAEGLYRYADVLRKQNHTVEAGKVAARADQFVDRVRYHGHKDGTFDEQINRYTGYMTSARDLTWNYAALLTTRQAIA